MPGLGKFGRNRATRNDVVATNDYGTPAPGRTNQPHRFAILANHWLHWISTLIVLGISGYFIHNYHHNTHLVYWVTIAAIDTALYLPALFLPAKGNYKGYLAPLAWIFSYLWLTAFIFAAQDYNSGSCAVSPSGVNKCHLKHTLEAFAFLAFFTSLLGHILESTLWARHSVAGRGLGRGTHGEKHVAGTDGHGHTAVAAGNTPVYDQATGHAAV